PLEHPTERDEALDKGEQGGSARPRRGATRQRCDIAPCAPMPAAVSATDRLAAIDSRVASSNVASTQSRHRGQAMGLLVIFIISVVIGQSLSIGLGLLVERYSTPYTGLITFIGSYFLMFWLAWRFALRITAPRSPERGGLSSAGKSSASEAA